MSEVVSRGRSSLGVAVAYVALGHAAVGVSGTTLANRARCSQLERQPQQHQCTGIREEGAGGWRGSQCV